MAKVKLGAAMAVEYIPTSLTLMTLPTVKAPAGTV
jgi:hypothetical protein